jgi:hypothetical protein
MTIGQFLLLLSQLQLECQSPHLGAADVVRAAYAREVRVHVESFARSGRVRGRTACLGSDGSGRCAEQKGAPVIANIADTTPARSDERNAPRTKESLRENKNQRSEWGAGTQQWNDTRVVLSLKGTNPDVPGRCRNEIVHGVVAGGSRVRNGDADQQSDNRDDDNGAFHWTPRLILQHQPKVSSAVPADASGPRP